MGAVDREFSRAVELAIVGGGPAALAAAGEAADAGLESILLIDDNGVLGGQYYRRPPDEFEIADADSLGRDYLRGRGLVQAIQRDSVRVVHDAVVWGILPEVKTLSLATAEHCWSLKAEALILATGAYDRPLAFPGWTLPGVMTAGAAQILLKTYRVLPGKRVLVAGSGPLLLALTAELVAAGAQVVAVAEARPLTPWLQHLGQAPALFADWQTLLDGFQYWRSMRAADVPYLSGHAVVEAQGRKVVEQAVVAELDDASHPIVGRERTWDVDAICIGYGFVPSTELARASGCTFEYAPRWGCFTPRVDQWMESSAPNLFVVGDAAGIQGVKIAEQQGRLAALAIAHRLGYVAGEQLQDRERSVRMTLHRLQRFRAAMDDVFCFEPRLQQHLITPDTIICRCEEVRTAQVYEAIADGATDVYGVKLRSHTGLGPCQGRNCSPVVAQMIAERTGRKPGEVAQFSLRPPVKPVPMAVLAGCEVLDPVKQ